MYGNKGLIRHIKTVVITGNLRPVRFLVFGQIFLILGCAQSTLQTKYDEQQQLVQQRELQGRERARYQTEQMLYQISHYNLPNNYQQLIDNYFLENLKDPESRRVEYTRTPYGSVVCGTINARNSFGGYTGKHPFLAYFDGDGKLLKLRSYPENELKALRNISDNFTYKGYPAPPGDILLEYKLVQDCSFILPT